MAPTTHEAHPMSTPNVRIETLPARRVAYMRHTGPYQECGPTFQKMMNYCMTKGLFGPNAVVLGVGHDNPNTTPPDKIRYDACITVNDSFQPDGEVKVQTLEGGTYAIASLIGPYDQLAATYQWFINTWLPASGKQMRMLPMFEIYRNSPTDTPPEKLLTEICMPLVG
jgi:AraC family transcriptional regulator